MDDISAFSTTVACLNNLGPGRAPLPTISAILAIPPRDFGVGDVIWSFGDLHVTRAIFADVLEKLTIALIKR